MKKIITIIGIMAMCLMMTINSKAQNNVVMDEILSSNTEPTGQKFDELVLYPNKSIKENYELIKNRMSLHREQNYAEYIICCKGRYINKKRGQICVVDIDDGFIRIKGTDNERFRTINGQIIHTLVGLYTQSLDEKFDISPDEHQSCFGAKYSTHKLPIASFNSNTGVKGAIYVEKRLPNHLVYKVERISFNGISPTWMAIYNKVIEETGLQDGGSLYDLGTKEERAFDVVEQQPTFPDGDPRVWIGNNIHYPPVAEENETQGTVVCQFIIETNGSIGNVTVVRGADPSLDKEAVRVVKSMPNWNPGKQNGRAVRVKYTLPVKFQL